MKNKFEKKTLEYFKAHPDKDTSFKQLRKEFAIKSKNPKLLSRAISSLLKQGVIEIAENRMYRLAEVNPHKVDENIEVEENLLPENILAVYNERAMLYQVLTKSLVGASLMSLEEDIDKFNLKDGNIVFVKPHGAKTKAGQKGKVISVEFNSAIGHETDIAIMAAGLMREFPEDVIAECEEIESGLSNKEISRREDLRDFPFVTIDGEDAKDFDDAVYAQKLSERTGKFAGGYHIIVAIADVAYYIKKGSKLEKEALRRGNSTYFPDMVIPMLPEKLSNDLCSLRPNEDRPVVAAHMYLDATGALRKFNFTRAVIHSKRRLTYNQVQDAIEETYCESINENFYQDVISPLKDAYQLLKTKREKRGALDLDKIETKIVLDNENNVLGIIPEQRFTAHMIIEELMILANIAAAKVLGKHTCMYRVHEKPNEEKVANLAKNLQALRVRTTISPKNQTPYDFKRLIDKIRHRDDSDSLMDIILRSQSRAEYSSENAGHFGLALTHYAHFTSPIRRFSDLVVHRSLISNLELASSGGIKYSNKKIDDIAEHINVTERVSQKAEWDAKEMLIAKFYSDKLDNTFRATVVSVNSFGLFVKLSDSAAEGLVPMRAMTNDYYIFDENRGILRGRRTRKTVKIGTAMKVRLTGANVNFGKLSFEFVRFI